MPQNGRPRPKGRSHISRFFFKSISIIDVQQGLLKYSFEKLKYKARGKGKGDW